jgi:putative serine protease PepD
VSAGSTRLAVLDAGDPKPHAARLIEYDCQAGYAVLKADGISGAPTLAFGSSAALKPGETLVALGRDGGRATVGSTIVSALAGDAYFPDPADPDRQIAVSDSLTADGRVLRGAGGVPLLNVGGQVVGVTLPTADGPTSATAAAMLQPGVQQVVGGSALAVGGLGAAWLDVSSEQAALRGGTAGAQLTAIDAGGPAATAGLQTGDVITQMDDLPVDDAHPLSLDLRSRFQPGQHVTISYVRSGRPAQVSLTLASQRPTCA